jgi:carboxymethylenebutenolidase
MTQTLGVVGLGRMGLAMAQRLRQHGFDVIGCDTRKEACAAFVTVGGRVAPTPRAVADEASVVFASLPTAGACREAAYGTNGVARGSALRVYVECSTIGPQAMREIAQRLGYAGMEAVDAPVSGDPAAASEGSLSVVVAGAPRAVQAAMQGLSCFCADVVEAGEQPGVAQVFKLVNQGLTHATFVLTAEALSAGVKSGAEPAALLAYLNANTARNHATTDDFPHRVLPRRFGTADLGVVKKDMGLYLEMCRQGGIPASVGQQAEAMMTMAGAILPPPLELSSIAMLYEATGGVELRGLAQPEPEPPRTLTATDGHVFDAYVARPRRQARSAVVVIHEIFGLNSHIRAICDRLAGEGYLAIAPALFDRAERGVELAYSPDDETRAREMCRQVSDEQAMKDVAVTVFRAAAELGPDGNVGVLGFSWGGTLAWLAAATLPVSAAVAYDGIGIPHYLSEAPQAPVLLHFGTRDDHVPPGELARIEATYPRLPVFQYDARYGFNCDERPTHDPDSARLAWKRTLHFLAERLG